MPVSRYASPFAKLSLTLDEKEMLSNMSDQIVSETMSQYERYLWQDKGRLDPAVWETVRERHGTRVSHNLLPGAGTGNRDMHLLLTIGRELGTLNDVMYGVINQTTEAFRIKTAYVKDTLLDMAVLDSIVKPTPERPYDSMTIRWLVKGVPLHVRIVTKHHDSVYLETSGMRQLSNGERVGVHLLHSITFDKTPVLPQYNRFNMSLCTIWRQATPDKIEGYLASYFELKDSILTNLVIKSMADALITIGKTIDCAQHKKLAWLVQNKAFRDQSEANSGRPPKEECAVCRSSDRSARRGLKSACAVCAQNTCDRCRVKRTLSMFAPDGQLLKLTVGICMPCLKTARQLDGMTIAMEEAAAGYSNSASDRNGLGMHTVSYTMSTSTASSVTSSQSGDEMRFPKRRSDSASSHSRGSKVLSLAVESNMTRFPEASGMP